MVGWGAPTPPHPTPLPLLPQDLSYNQLTECPRELENAKNMLVLNLGHNRWGCTRLPKKPPSPLPPPSLTPPRSGSPCSGRIRGLVPGPGATPNVPVSPQHRGHPQPALHQPNGPAVPRPEQQQAGEPPPADAAPGAPPDPHPQRQPPAARAAPVRPCIFFFGGWIPQFQGCAEPCLGAIPAPCPLCVLAGSSRR